MRAIVVIIAMATGLPACGEDSTPACVPATPATCFCPTGGPGQKVCDEEGLDYGACTCSVDAGVDAPTPPTPEDGDD